MSSDTSEPVVLDKPEDESQPPSRPTPPTRQSTLTPKKCWVCLCTQDEDDPNQPPVWRSPCACTLTAHEACLLDWVADLENPQKKDRGSDKTIKCPQCKHEIRIARPTSYVLEATKAIDRALAAATLPGLGFVFSGMLLTGCWAHGFQAVYAVFGREHAAQIFFQATKAQLFFYPLIPINLIASRTSFANSVLNSGTFALLSTQINPHRLELDLTLWPPLPSTVFICLPAVRRVYNWAYLQAFGTLNRKWLEAVQPASVQNIDTEEVNLADIANQNALAEGEEGVVLEVQLDIGVGAPEEGDGEGGEEGANAEGGQGNNNGNAAHVHQIGEIVEGIGIGSTVLGALAFPFVSAAMGHLLGAVLPRAWLSSSNVYNGRPGLLRAQWGRSVVGGAIFIVLKDALLLYSRWKRAQTHKMRRIVDYDKKAKKYLM